ncbi:hypothetical protein Bbelb_159540 [Branchiostoma belcheri]|nr:hypothetical protein Bbelb_159540 [Branchiostoma belcheri]
MYVRISVDSRPHRGELRASCARAGNELCDLKNRRRLVADVKNTFRVSASFGRLQKIAGDPENSRDARRNIGRTTARVSVFVVPRRSVCGGGSVFSLVGVVVKVGRGAADDSPDWQCFLRVEDIYSCLQLADESSARRAGVIKADLEHNQVIGQLTASIPTGTSTFLLIWIRWERRMPKCNQNNMAEELRHVKKRKKGQTFSNNMANFYLQVIGAGSRDTCPALFVFSDSKRTPYTVTWTPCTVIWTPYTVIWAPYAVIWTPYAVIWTPYAVIWTPYAVIWACDLDPLRCDFDPLRCDLGPLHCDLGPLRCDLDPLRCDLDPLRCDLGPLCCDFDPLRCDLGL